MSYQVLRNSRGNKIGEIETRSNGTQIIRDSSGVKKGEYDPRTNKTRDDRGVVIGEGNLLASLVR